MSSANEKLRVKIQKRASIIREKLYAYKLTGIAPSALIVFLQDIVNKDITPLINECFRESKVSPKAGLISRIKLVADWNRDWGKVIYTFKVGDDDTWNRHVSDVYGIEKTKSIVKCNMINNALQNQEVAIERIFSDNNVTAKILRRERSSFSVMQDSGEIVAKASPKGASKIRSFKTKHPWCLVQDQDFPMLYLGVFNNDDPLGFLQLSLAWTGKRPKPDSDEIFANCFSKSDEETKRIISSLSFLSSILIRELLLYLNNSFEYIENMQSLDTVYDSNIQHKLLDNELINFSFYKEEMREFREYFIRGYCKPNDLALKTISSLWKRNILLQRLELADLNKAESSLYWHPKYREHLVHSVKVFILGNWMIHKIWDDQSLRGVILKNSFGNNACKKAQKFQELWMIAATFHDYCSPIEFFSGSLKELFKKLMGTHIEADGEYSKRLFLSELFYRETMIYTLFHVLHFHYPPAFEGGEQLNRLRTDNYIWDIFKEDGKWKQFEQLRTYGIVHSKILNHFLTNGDHGISSAIKLLSECFPQGGSSVVALEKDKDKTLNERDVFKSYFQTIYAIFFHNYIEKSYKDGDRDVPIFDGVVVFKNDPIAFLLLLCDTIQDWGREESASKELALDNERSLSSDRPICRLSNIHYANGEMTISVQYMWEIIKDNAIEEYISIGTGECYSNAQLKKPNKKCKDCSGPNNGCDYLTIIKSKWSGLQAKMNTGIKSFKVKIITKRSGMDYQLFEASHG